MDKSDVDRSKAMFKYTEEQFKDECLMYNCYAIVNVLIRNSGLYALDETTLSQHVFENRFRDIHHMSHWISEITGIVYAKQSFGDGSLLKLPPRSNHTLDTFNVDDKLVRMSSFDCLENLRTSLTNMYIALVACVIERPHYLRMFDHYFQDVFLYLENYIKVIEYEQRESEEHPERPG